MSVTRGWSRYQDYVRWVEGNGRAKVAKGHWTFCRGMVITIGVGFQSFVKGRSNGGGLYRSPV